MPGEGVVSIGATFDKTNVDAGLGDTQAMVKASMEGISNTITEANAKSKAAWKGLSDEVKTSAASMNAEALKVAESSKAVAAAQMDVRRAWTLSRDAAIPLEQSMGTLAAAQVRLSELQAEAAAAAKAQAATVAAAAEEEALSQNVVIAAFQRASLNVRESLTEIQEKMIQTAETGGLEAEGISAGFGGLSKLLGAGIAVGFAANYIDGLAKINVELEHLATKTGIGITSLAGLQQILKEAGGDFESVATGLVRMESNVEKLSEGKKAPEQLADAFTNLGLKLDDVRRAKPEELLQMVATGMANEANANIRANSAIAIFGRGGQALIPVLREQGALLTENMRKTGELTGVTDESAEAARRWTQDVARLSAQFRSVMIPVMEHAEDLIRAIAGTFETAAAIIVSAFEGVATVLVSVFAALYKLGALMRDIFTGNWSAIKADQAAVVTEFVDTWKNGFATIKGNWEEVYHTFTDKSALPPVPKADDGEPGDYTAPGAKGKKAPRNAAFQADKELLDEIKLGHKVTVEEEIEFWQKKLAVAKKGSDEYKSIVATLASLEQKQDRQPAKKGSASDELQRPDISGGLGAFEAELQEEKKLNDTAIKENIQAAREAAEEKMRIAHEDYEDVEKNANFEVEMGRMTATQRLAVLRQAAIEENSIRQQQSKIVEMLDSNDQKRYEADLRKEEQDTRQFTRQITQLHQQAALQVQKYWKAGFNVINQDLTQLLNDYMKGTKNMEQVFAKMFQSILQQAADWVLQMLLKQAEMWAEMKIQQAVAAAQQKAIQAVTNEAKVVADSGVAGAGAMAYYSATDPEAAPALAAAQAAATMAFGAAALYDTGGMMPHGGLGVNLSGADERVLDPKQTANFEKMVNQSSSSSSKSVTNHLHYEPKVQGSDRAAMKRDLREHADTIMDIVRSGYRSGQLTG